MAAHTSFYNDTVDDMANELSRNQEGNAMMDELDERLDIRKKARKSKSMRKRQQEIAAHEEELEEENQQYISRQIRKPKPKDPNAAKVNDWFKDMNLNKTFSDVKNDDTRSGNLHGILGGRRERRSTVTLARGSAWDRFMGYMSALDRSLPIIHPRKPFRTSWDVFTMGLVIFNAVTVPLYISYGLPPNKGLELFNYMTDLIFAIDICFNFRTAYIDKQGNLIRDSGPIAKNYLKFWFPIDFFATVPYDLLAKAMGFGDSQSQLTILQFLKTPRLLRLGKLIRMLDRVKNANVFKVANLIALMCMIAHWLACIWYMMFKFSNMAPNVEDWSFNPQYNDKAISFYLSAFYQCFLMLVGNNQEPVNNAERTFFIVIGILGTCFYSAVVGQMAVLVANMAPVAMRHRQRQDMTMDVLCYAGCPDDQKERVRYYFDYIAKFNHPSVEGLHFLSDLPKALFQEVAAFLYRERLAQVPIFQGLERAFLTSLSLRMKIVSFTPKEVIFRAGDLGQEMYIIRKGCVAVVGKGDQLMSVLGDGEHFGEIALFTQAKRTAKCVALSNCDLCILSRFDLTMVMKDFPTSALQLQDTAAERLRQLQVAGRAGFVPDSDSGEDMDDDDDYDSYQGSGDDHDDASYQPLEPGGDNKPHNSNGERASKAGQLLIKASPAMPDSMAVVISPETAEFDKQFGGHSVGRHSSARQSAKRLSQGGQKGGAGSRLSGAGKDPGSGLAHVGSDMSGGQSARRSARHSGLGGLAPEASGGQSARRSARHSGFGGLAPEASDLGVRQSSRRSARASSRLSMPKDTAGQLIRAGEELLSKPSPRTAAVALTPSATSADGVHPPPGPGLGPPKPAQAGRAGEEDDELTKMAEELNVDLSQAAFDATDSTAAAAAAAGLELDSLDAQLAELTSMAPSPARNARLSSTQLHSNPAFEPSRASRGSPLPQPNTGAGVPLGEGAEPSNGVAPPDPAALVLVHRAVAEARDANMSSDDSAFQASQDAGKEGAGLHGDTHTSNISGPSGATNTGSRVSQQRANDPHNSPRDRLRNSGEGRNSQQHTSNRASTDTSNRRGGNARPNDAAHLNKHLLSTLNPSPRKSHLSPRRSAQDSLGPLSLVSHPLMVATVPIAEDPQPEGDDTPMFGENAWIRAVNLTQKGKKGRRQSVLIGSSATGHEGHLGSLFDPHNDERGSAASRHTHMRRSSMERRQLSGQRRLNHMESMSGHSPSPGPAMLPRHSRASGDTGHNRRHSFTMQELVKVEVAAAKAAAAVEHEAEQKDLCVKMHMLLKMLETLVVKVDSLEVRLQTTSTEVARLDKRQEEGEGVMGAFDPFAAAAFTQQSEATIIRTLGKIPSKGILRAHPSSTSLK